MAQEEYVGIDFGAVNIKAAKGRGRSVETVRLNSNQFGGVATANVILYQKTKDGKSDNSIGDSAKQERYSADPDDFVQDIKRKMEQEAWSQFIPCLGQPRSAEEAARDILAVVRPMIIRQIGLDQEEAKLPAAITVPVCFSSVQRARVRRAAQAAGFDVQQVLTEPLAAVFSQEDLFSGGAKHDVLVFDFGGSTLDISLLTIDTSGDGPVVVTEHATAAAHLGGLYFDTWIAEEILRPQYEAQAGSVPADGSGAEGELLRRDLLDRAQDMKEKLFAEDDGETEDDAPERRRIVSHENGEMYTLEARRSDVAALLARHGVRETIEHLIDSVLDDAELDDEAIDHLTVKAFGGSMHFHAVIELLRERFGEDAFDMDDDEAWEDEIYTSVAEGAVQFFARQAGRGLVIRRERLPYQLGFLRYGGTFVPCFTHGMAPETWSMDKSVEEEDIREGRLPVCQRFSDGDPVYIGSIPFDGLVFRGRRILQLMVDEADVIRYRMFDAAGEDGEAPVDEGIVPIDDGMAAADGRE